MAVFLGALGGTGVQDRYFHWADLKYRKPPGGSSHEDWWLALKIHRKASRHRIPLKDQVGETIGGAQLVAAEKAGELSAAIRSNPMRSAAVAAGVGFVIGLLMTR